MRRALVLLVAVTALVFTNSALAATFNSSTVTAPADGTFPLFTSDAPNTIHVQGTTDNSDSNADLVCFFGTSSILLKSNVTVAGNAFSEDVDLTPLGNAFPKPYCTLRAVPTGDTTDYPPGAPSTFVGSDIGIGNFGTSRIVGGPNDGLMVDYKMAQAQPEGQTDIRSIGSCGLDYGFIFDPLTFAQSKEIFFCNGWLSTGDGCNTGSGTCKVRTRSELVVDGANAYTPEGALELYNDGVHKSSLLSGFPLLTQQHTIDPMNGDVSIAESDETVKCSPNGTAFHAVSNDAGWQTDCSSFAPTGVKVDRSILVDRKGRRTTMIDVWSSVDGAAHELDIRYDEDFYGDGSNPPGSSYQYSWLGSSYDTPTFGQTVPGPTSEMPVTIMVDGNTSGTADEFKFPQGAVTYSDAPSEIYWYYLDGTSTGATFHFTRSVPAGGSVIIGRSYIAGADKPELTAQVPAEQARLGRPKVSITGPGSTVDTASVLATGTAVDPAGGITALKVNGDAVTVGADGSWTKALTLHEGENTITATATDTSDNAVTVTKKVTFTPPAPAGPVPVPTPAAKDTIAPALGLAITRTRLAKLLSKGLPVKVRCSEACSFTLTLVQGRTTIGKLSGRLTAAGTKKVTVKLSKKAKKRLRKARKLKLTLKLAAKDSAGNSARKTAKVTIKR